METVLKSDTREVKISGEGPIVIIGEKINPTGRKKLAAAFQAGDLEYVRQLAEKQVAAGADLLDVNVGVPDLDYKARRYPVSILVCPVVENPHLQDNEAPPSLRRPVYPDQQPGQKPSALSNH